MFDILNRKVAFTIALLIIVLVSSFFGWVITEKYKEVLVIESSDIK